MCYLAPPVGKNVQIFGNIEYSKEFKIFKSIQLFFIILILRQAKLSIELEVLIFSTKYRFC